MAYFKEEHEQFISGHNGTSYLEVAFLTSTPCFSCLFRDLLFLSSSAVSNGKFFRSTFFINFLLVIIPNILSVTLLENHLGVMILSLLLSCAMLCLFLKQSDRTNVNNILMSVTLEKRNRFITYFRSIIVVCTAVAILAVDFPVFPRRLAKAETYGFGGMDIGVGLFVVANAIVCPQAKNKSEGREGFFQTLKKSVVSSIPLFCLGLLRLAAVKSMEYHEHVTEYGVHWNFFFTLVALKVLLTIVYLIVPGEKSNIFAFITVIIHQVFLSNGLSSYIILGHSDSGTRIGLLDANREGILSLPGYVAIYMFGVHLGSILFQEKKNLLEWLQDVKTLCVYFVIFTAAMLLTHLTVEPVSRRMANAAFVFWVMSVSSLMLIELLLCDIIISFFKCQNYIKTIKDTSLSPGAKSVCILTAINLNPLFLFLLANIMTGLVNTMFTTHHIPDSYALLILTLYILILCHVSVWLYDKKMSIKLS